MMIALKGCRSFEVRYRSSSPWYRYIVGGRDQIIVRPREIDFDCHKQAHHNPILSRQSSIISV